MPTSVDAGSSRAVTVIGFVAGSGTGKTTLLERVVPLLVDAGLEVGVIKLTHHDVDVDVPGKDSHRLRSAGARRTLLASPQRWMLIGETPGGNGIPDIDYLLGRMDADRLDVVLVEGGRHLPIPRLRLYRSGVESPREEGADASVVAVVCDAEPPGVPPGIPRLDIDDPAQVAGFIRRFVEARGA